jgi:phosphatidate cytidylyltransferase
VTRVLSALVLLPVVIGTIWFLPPWGTLALALIVAALAFAEYRAIAQALGAWIPAGIGGTAVILVCYTVWAGDNLPFTTAEGIRVGAFGSNVPIVLMSLLIVVGGVSVARGRPAPSVLADAAATVFAPVYLGLPLGALAVIRFDWIGGREAVLLLIVIIVISDSAQYYCGRAFGRRQLSAAISPKKTVEGAIGGVLFGTLAMLAGGFFLFATPLWLLALAGAAISLLGIVGDLFESLLKRSAGVKDSSQLIPGHGGVLDRIDSWLFAAPVYYVFVRFVA